MTNLPTATLGTAITNAKRNNIIDQITRDKTQALWVISNNNNTRHATGGAPQLTPIEEARKTLIEVGELSLHIMEQRTETFSEQE
jgi:hypothetical protein